MLEEHLARTSAAVIVASHDRRFLDNVIRKVAHLDLGELKVYPGNYSAFQRQREEEIATDRAVYDKRQKETKKLRVVLLRMQCPRKKIWSFELLLHCCQFPQEGLMQHKRLRMAEICLPSSCLKEFHCLVISRECSR